MGPQRRGQINARDAQRRWQLLLIGVDHRSAPVELREKVAYRPDEEASLLESLVTHAAIAEAFLLSTCNRTELYVRTDDATAAYPHALDVAFTSRCAAIEQEGRFFAKRDDEAIRHLFEVAGGLQSMVLGEPEILGQVKQSAGRAENTGTSGVVLSRLLVQAIAAGGRARRDTAIGAGAVSFGYAVVELARTIFHRLEDCSVLLVGAGETARLVARNLSERGARELRISNRGSRRVEQFLADFPQARVVPFDERAQALDEVDVVVASTTAPEPVILRDDLRQAMSRRRGKPLLVADLGVPRNVETTARGIENLFLQDVDSLENLIGRNLKQRRSEIPRVQEILDNEQSRFADWCRSLAAEPLVAALHGRAEALRRREVESVQARFPTELHDDLDKLTRALVRKLLHHPSQHLRRDQDDPLPRFQLVRELFDLDDEKSS